MLGSNNLLRWLEDSGCWGTNSRLLHNPIQYGSTSDTANLVDFLWLLVECIPTPQVGGMTWNEIMAKRDIKTPFQQLLSFHPTSVPLNEFPKIHPQHACTPSNMTPHKTTRTPGQANNYNSPVKLQTKHPTQSALLSQNFSSFISNGE